MSEVIGIQHKITDRHLADVRHDVNQITAVVLCPDNQPAAFVLV
jgi:hypothetical protein